MFDRVRDKLLQLLRWAKIRPSNEHLSTLREEVTRRESERQTKDMERNR